MRYLIILLIFLISCKSEEEISVYEERLSNVYSYVDEDNDGYTDYEDVEITVDKIVVGSSGQEYYEVGTETETEMESVESYELYEEYQISPKHTQPPVGKMAYSIPDTMKVGQQYDISLRITKYEKDSILIEGIDRNDQVKSKIVINDIRVGSVMSAVLIDVDSNFVVKSTSTTEQNIEDFGYTQWLWKVKPIKSGNNKLRLLIKVRVFTENGDYLKDIPVYDQKIKVHSNIPWTLKSWISKYWQWLMSTIVIPIFIYFWKRRKKDKSTNPS
jgi:hypothetical protein